MKIEIEQVQDRWDSPAYKVTLGDQWWVVSGNWGLGELFGFVQRNEAFLVDELARAYSAGDENE